jgi:hypothetical protein
MRLSVDSSKVLADGAAMIESQTRTDCEPLSYVRASLANTAPVMNTPPLFDGGAEMA